MNRFIIGDVQACLDDLHRLLALLPSPRRLIFLGDLVNRGPASAETLRFVRALPDAVTVLGNHDLHLLASAAGIRKLHDDDTLDDVLAAPDRDDLLDWLRRRPLAHAEAGALFVHAGVLPAWNVAKTLALAAEVEAGLRSDDYPTFLATMYGNAPARWDDRLQGADRSRCIINALTRVRFVTPNGTMNLKIKESSTATVPGMLPWFDHPQRAQWRAAGDGPIVFGHWSTLGLMQRDDAVCLDSGCVWGGALTALSWPAREVFQVWCPAHRRPTPVQSDVPPR